MRPLTSALPTISVPVVLDGTTQPGFTSTPVVVLDGTNAGASTVGLTISAGNSTVEGLVIDNFGGDGIDLTTNGGNLVEGDFIGTNAAGTVAAANGGSGIVINTANNTIGTDSSGNGTGNLISGNTQYGVEVTGSSATGNAIAGNLIGTDTHGTSAVANSNYGVYVNVSGVAAKETIGGTVTAARNVISGNSSDGVRIAPGSGSVVQGNFIGVDATGNTALLNNGSGVTLVTSGITIGGTTSGAGNIISGNAGDGIEVYAGGSTPTYIQGNIIGLGADGSTALGNIGYGIYLALNSTNVVIGGSTAAARNVISENNFGIILDTQAANVTIQGNYVGTDATGNLARSNVRVGIDLSSPNGTIRGNVVSGNNAVTVADGIVVRTGATALSPATSSV